jgi:hypothetical protein
MLPSALRLYSGGWVNDDEIERTRKEALVAKSEVLLRYLPGGAEENQDSRYPRESN